MKRFVCTLCSLPLWLATPTVSRCTASPLPRSTGAQEAKSPAEERAYALLEEAWKGSEGKTYYARDFLPLELAPYDPALSLKLARKPDGSVTDFTQAWTVMVAVNSDRESSRTWAVPIVEKIASPAHKVIAQTFLALALVKTQREKSAALYKQASDALKTLPAAAGFDESIVARISLLALAARMKMPEAPTLLEQALEAGGKMVEAKQVRDLDEILTAIAEVVAKGSPEMADSIAAKMLPRHRSQARARALEEISRYDPAAARTILERMDAAHPSERDGYGQGAKYVIAAIGPTDPNGAFAIAQKVTSPQFKALALALAARFQKQETARNMLQEALNAENNVHTLARIGAMTLAKEPEHSAAFFAKARKSAEIQEQESSRMAAFAFYYAQKDPIESRKVLDAAWDRRRQSSVESNKAVDLKTIAMAMVAADEKRAVELARLVPGDMKFEALRKIAQYVLASDGVRKTIPFDRWSASDTWLPGTPTGW